MLENDIYVRRFKDKAESLGFTDMPADERIDKYRTDGVAPSLAVSKYFSKLKIKSRVSKDELEPLVISACNAFGADPMDVALSDTEEMRDLKTIVCRLAVNEMNIRPHTVIRKRLGLKYNSMVNHHVDRFATRTDRVGFLDKFEVTKKAMAL
jgi:hypothetical protein